jgi:hypothetical protein
MVCRYEKILVSGAGEKIVPGAGSSLELAIETRAITEFRAPFIFLWISRPVFLANMRVLKWQRIPTTY